MKTLELLPILTVFEGAAPDTELAEYHETEVLSDPGTLARLRLCSPINTELLPEEIFCQAPVPSISVAALTGRIATSANTASAASAIVNRLVINHFLHF
jgi:hypothetical protein